MSNPLRALGSALGEQVEALEHRAQQVFRVLDLVRSALPKPEKTHVVSASYHDETLVVYVDSAIWTAHVRYLEKSLRQQLAAAGEKPFTILKVRVGRPTE